MNNVIITLRTSEEIKRELDRLALEENRSLNNYIITLLIKHIEDKKKESEIKEVSQRWYFLYFCNLLMSLMTWLICFWLGFLPIPLIKVSIIFSLIGGFLVIYFFIIWRASKNPITKPITSPNRIIKISCNIFSSPVFQLYFNLSFKTTKNNLSMKSLRRINSV